MLMKPVTESRIRYLKVNILSFPAPLLKFNWKKGKNLVDFSDGPSRQKFDSLSLL